MPTDKAASIFKVPDEGADYHNFEFNLHEAYTIMTGLPADESDPKQTFVTKFNTNSFPPVLRVIYHMLTTIITPQGGRRDRLTDIQRFILYCMAKDIKINLYVIMYQIISETTRKDLKRSLPYAAHLTSMFQHFGVPLNNEKSQSIPKSNIYSFKNIQKFMGFRLEGTQVRRGPVVVEAPQAQEEQPQGQGDQPQGQEEQPQGQGDQPQGQEEQPQAQGDQPQGQEEQLQAQGDQPQGQEDQPPLNEDQPQVSTEGDIPFHAPLSPQFQHFSPQPTFHASTSSGGPSVPPELFSFLNENFETLNSSIQTMSETFELTIQRLENTVSAKFIEQKGASDYAAQRFNRLIGTLGDASIELKEHQEKLEQVLKGILANSQADVFNTKQTLHEITSTRLSFAHFVDDLESMRNFNAHIDNQITDLTKEFKIMQRPGTNTFCKGSVDTPHNGVDTTPQTQRQKAEEMLRLQALILKDFNAKAEIIARAPIIVRWNPLVNNYSFNVDGACKGNPSLCGGGGGCLRDSNGDFVCGFAFFYGIGISLMAETRAIHDGLRLAMERHLNVSIMYFDSALLVRAITLGQLPHWAIFPWWRDMSSHSGSRVRRLRTVDGVPSRSSEDFIVGHPSQALLPITQGASSTASASSSVASRGAGRRGPSRGATERRLERGHKWNVRVIGGYGVIAEHNKKNHTH
ncbi:hypothetical protein Taro_055795 [Colocasia esculenta]|uniref:RNase H type-1 domain-containing protein n=1 Tax=Colocasia esculenta TaxID=4460 RepID=A0A843XRV4_COLES|nr:hypothetical protein [Colocasia esculenta]